jgi:hypothetical protein
VVKKFGDDKGGNLTTLLAWNGFFALFPLLLILVTALGFLLSRHPALEQRVLHSTLAEFPIIGDQLQRRGQCRAGPPAVASQHPAAAAHPSRPACPHRPRQTRRASA